MVYSSYLSGNGQSFGQAGMLVSQNNLFQLILQTDGNLVVYYWPGGYTPNGTYGPCNVVWSPETFGSPARTLYFNNGWLAVAWGNAANNEIAWTVNGNPGGSTQTYCVSMDNDGCVRIYPSATPPAWNWASPPTTATWQSPNCILANILYGPAVTPYPAFAGSQATLYNNNGNPVGKGAPTNLVGEFIAKWTANYGAPPTTITDLRTDVYPYAQAYFSNNDVQTVLSQVHREIPGKFPPGCSQADWNAIYNQLSGEVTALVNLASFQGSFTGVVNSTNLNLLNGLANAKNYLGQQSFSAATGNGELFAMLAGMFAVAGAIFAPLTCAVLGAMVGIVAALPDGTSDALSGELAAIQTALGNIEASASNVAEWVYPSSPTGLLTNPIAGDWGKLQLFASLYNLGVFGTSVNFASVENQFEISVYQTVLPGLVAIIPQTNSGPPTPGETMGFSLTPSASYGSSPSGLLLESGPLWQRLTSANGLGLDPATILARQGVWASLPLYTWTTNTFSDGGYLTYYYTRSA